MFDPQEVGIGIHWVYYQAPTGCWDSCRVDVYQLQPAEIIGLENTYCFIDSSVSLIGLPANGVFSGNGMSDTIFNPSLAGEGIHTITYEHGSAGCEVHEDILVSISPPITTTKFGQGIVICLGDPVTVGVEATGGNGTPFTHEWDPNATWFPTQTPVLKNQSAFRKTHPGLKKWFLGVPSQTILNAIVTYRFFIYVRG